MITTQNKGRTRTQTSLWCLCTKNIFECITSDVRHQKRGAKVLRQLFLSIAVHATPRFVPFRPKFGPMLRGSLHLFSKKTYFWNQLIIDLQEKQPLHQL